MVLHSFNPRKPQRTQRRHREPRSTATYKFALLSYIFQRIRFSDYNAFREALERARERVVNPVHVHRTVIIRFFKESSDENRQFIT